jgi:hypothetical protein
LKGKAGYSEGREEKKKKKKKREKHKEGVVFGVVSFLLTGLIGRAGDGDVRCP